MTKSHVHFLGAYYLLSGLEAGHSVVPSRTAHNRRQLWRLHRHIPLLKVRVLLLLRTEKVSQGRVFQGRFSHLPLLFYFSRKLLNCGGAPIMGQFDRRIERAAVLVLGFGVLISVNGFLDALFGDGNV